MMKMITQGKRKKLKLTAFWVPGVQVVAVPENVKKPELEDPTCPEGGHTIKLKNLLSLHFTGSKAGGNDKFPFECASCGKSLSNSVKTVALKRCGHVMCVQCGETMKSDKRCAICNAKIKKGKDVIPIQSGGTGYAGSLGEKLTARSTATPALHA